MDFMTAVRTVLTQRYADFKGRSRRSEFWWYALFQFAASIVAQIIAVGLASSGSGALAAIGGLLYLAVILGLLIPSIAVSVRRMHDIGKSGWLVLLFIIPIVGFILMLVWFTQRGTVGPNEYGDDPYDAAPAAA